LCIARTIALKPKIILMDEPTSALDPISTAKIEQLIGELREDFTIVAVTHSMHQAQRISDYVAFMLNGKIEEAGLTKKLFSIPDKQTTKNYITGREINT
jgi:phosphate transport system ATP-binding protein